MTAEQLALFIQIAQMGVACGLSSPEEWLLNYTLHQTNFEVYDDIPENYHKALEAYAAFWRGTASDPDEETFFVMSTTREMINYKYKNAKLVP